MWAELWNKIKRPQFLVGLLMGLAIYFRDKLGINLTDQQIGWFVALVVSWILGESGVDMIRAKNTGAGVKKLPSEKAKKANPRISRVPLAMLLAVLLVAGCVSPQQRLFLNRHAVKVNEYVTAVEVSLVPLAKQVIEESDLPPARKAALRQKVGLVQQRSADLLLDAATIRRVWGSQ